MKQYIIAAAVAAALPAAAQADTLVVDVSGAQSFSDFQSGLNDVLLFDIGAGSHVTNVSYDVNLTAFDPSWLSELRLAYTDNDPVSAGVFLTPSIGDSFSGTADYSGTSDLVDLDLDFFTGADGMLRLEFFEGFDDGAVDPDGIWNSGTITFTFDTAIGAVPEPATWAFMIFGFGAIGGAMRSRRKTKLNVSYA